MARAKLISRDHSMKKALLAFLQLVVFLLVFLAGSLLAPFHIEHVLSSTPAGTRIFIVDGYLLMVILFIAILLIETLRKRIVAAGPWTTAAFILATAMGFAMKFGLLTRSAF
jgi:hypothetical protein